MSCVLCFLIGDGDCGSCFLNVWVIVIVGVMFLGYWW